MGIVNGRLKPTPVKYLSVMSGIAPPALCIEHHMAMLVKALPDTSQFLNASVTRAQKPWPPTPTLSSTLQPSCKIISNLQLKPIGGMAT